MKVFLKTHAFGIYNKLFEFNFLSSKRLKNFPKLYLLTHISSFSISNYLNFFVITAYTKNKIYPINSHFGNIFFSSIPPITKIYFCVWILFAIFIKALVALPRSSSSKLITSSTSLVPNYFTFSKRHESFTFIF